MQILRKRNNLDATESDQADRLPPELSIIIVNYNTTDWVKKALTSIKKYTYSSESKESVRVNVFVVDNGSSDQSIQKITEEFPFVEFIALPENVGFAGGNNVALKKVITPYVMLLNSDAELTADTHLEKMLKYLQKNRQVAVVTPHIELSDGGIDWASHRGEPTPWASLTYFSKLEKIFPHSTLFGQYHQTYKDLNTIHEIDACSGAAMIVRTSAMKKVGYLDERFFMYAEDLDWCKRFRDQGYSIVYFPESVIIHHKYKSGRGSKNKKLSKKTSTYFYDTMLQYYDKHYRTAYPAPMRWMIQIFIHLRKGVI